MIDKLKVWLEFKGSRKAQFSFALEAIVTIAWLVSWIGGAFWPEIRDSQYAVNFDKWWNSSWANLGTYGVMNAVESVGTKGLSSRLPPVTEDNGTAKA